MIRGSGLRVTLIGDRAVGGGTTGLRGLGGPTGLPYDVALEWTEARVRVARALPMTLEAITDANQC